MKLCCNMERWRNNIKSKDKHAPDCQMFSDNRGIFIVVNKTLSKRRKKTEIKITNKGPILTKFIKDKRYNRKSRR